MTEKIFFLDGEPMLEVKVWRDLEARTEWLRMKSAFVEIWDKKLLKVPQVKEKDIATVLGVNPEHVVISRRWIIDRKLLLLIYVPINTKLPHRHLTKRNIYSFIEPV